MAKDHASAECEQRLQAYLASQRTAEQQQTSTSSWLGTAMKQLRQTIENQLGMHSRSGAAASPPTGLAKSISSELSGQVRNRIAQSLGPQVATLNRIAEIGGKYLGPLGNKAAGSQPLDQFARALLGVNGALDLMHGFGLLSDFSAARMQVSLNLFTDIEKNAFAQLDASLNRFNLDTTLDQAQQQEIAMNQLTQSTENLLGMGSSGDGQESGDLAGLLNNLQQQYLATLQQRGQVSEKAMAAAAEAKRQAELQRQREAELQQEQQREAALQRQREYRLRAERKRERQQEAERERKREQLPTGTAEDDSGPTQDLQSPSAEPSSGSEPPCPGPASCVIH